MRACLAAFGIWLLAAAPAVAQWDTPPISNSGLLNNTINVTPSTDPLIISGNTDGGSTPPGTNTLVSIVGADGHPARGSITAYGGTAFWLMRSAGGTQSIPAAIISGAVLGQISINGYDGTTYSSSTGLMVTATENYSPTAHGVQTSFTYTPNGTIIVMTGMTLQQSGDVTIGTATDVPGGGKLQVTGGILADTFTGNGAGLTNLNVAPVNLAAGGGAALVGPRSDYICTTTCTMTLPIPAPGYQFCVRNDDNVTTRITFAAISGVLFENTNFTSYKTANTSIASGGAVGDKLCVLGRDATHYLVESFLGTWG